MSRILQFSADWETGWLAADLPSGVMVAVYCGRALIERIPVSKGLAEWVKEKKMSQDMAIDLTVAVWLKNK